MNTIPLSKLLDLLAKSPQLVPGNTDRAVLESAGRVVRERLALPAGVAEPTVLVVAGHLADPVAASVQDMQATLDSLADEVRTFDDQLDAVLRLLRKKETTDA